MAQALAPARAAAARQEALPQGFWPVDRLIGAYLLGTALLIAAYYDRVPHAGWLLALHAVGVAAIVVMAKIRFRLAAVLRHWYPLPFVAACYWEMALLIPATRGVAFDAEAAALDFRIWGAHPTVWLERLSSAWLTECLQVAYSLFVPAVLLVAAVLWKQGRFAGFRYYALLISAGFLASYIGYWLIPVRGPRFLLADLQTANLTGLWLFPHLQQLLDKLESAHYDCFPSGHVELTLLACWGSRMLSTNLFRGYFVYSLVIVFATVYLRYHYTVDVLGGALFAAALIVLLRPLRAY